MSNPTPTTNATTTTAAKIPVAKPKQYDDLYEGLATITSTDATELRFTDGLTEDEVAAGFIIVLRVQPKDEKISAQTVELEFSDRECKFPKTDIGKKQKQVTREALFAHKLITGADAANANVADVFSEDVVGKEIMIKVTKITDPNKEPDRQTRISCTLSNRRPSLSPAERARRIALLTGQPMQAAQAPAQAAPVTVNPF